MSIEFKMPALGADMEAATLVEWKIKPGDVVKRGDVVAVVETDKGAIDIEIYASGTAEKLIVEPGTKVPVGGVLAMIAGESPSLPLSKIASEKDLPDMTARSDTVSPRSPSGEPIRQKISPAARAHAHKLNIALDSIHGTGPGGVITLQDVQDAAKVTTKKPASSMRDVIAAAMARSKREIPHYYLSLDVDYQRVAQWLATRNAELPIEQRMLPIVPLLRAIVLALQSSPEFNGYFKGGVFEPSPSIHLGVAIAQRGGGLIAPALLDAHTQTLPQLTANLRDLVNRVRAGRLTNRELSDGTITLTSLGDGGVDAVWPIIYPPQVSILGAGTVRERPWAESGAIAARPVMTLTLAADHRVSNGRDGAQLLARIRDLLQKPEQL